MYIKFFISLVFYEEKCKNRAFLWFWLPIYQEKTQPPIKEGWVKGMFLTLYH